MYHKFGQLVCEILGTNQNYHVEQQDDGTYRKKNGLVTANFLKESLEKKRSIAIYQKNTDLTIKWLCFDFDILKGCLENEQRDIAQKELDKTVDYFCHELKSLGIPYLLEFSGNRGFHVWITFEDPINYQTGYDIQQTILKECGLSFQEQLIGIDLYPHSATPSGGTGSGVKLPLSKHKKSGYYSYLLLPNEQSKSIQQHEELSFHLLESNIEILEQHRSINRPKLEEIFGTFFESHNDEDFLQSSRIKSIKVERAGFNLSELLLHWKSSAPLSKLASKIEKKENLSNAERKLIVGLICNITARDNSSFSHELLHEIFKQFDNYNPEITNSAIVSLRSFYFPNQDKIETTLNAKFEGRLSTEDLIKSCIPKYLEFKNAFFEYSEKDIEITKISELNYLFINDEVQSKVIIEELVSKDNTEYLGYLERFINGSRAKEFHRHLRNEGDKTRELITLSSNLRVATTTITKQLSYFLDLEQNENSHGYQINKGFSEGHIFKPWLYLWLKFISNITEYIEKKEHFEHYIVKTDIRRFYNSIPHDNLKRFLLGDGKSPFKDKFQLLDDNTNTQYKKCLDALFKISVEIMGESKGLPQGPAYARFLAELYLAGLDNEFQSSLQKSDVYLYQRYVDDIFFVTKSREEAIIQLESLKSKLALLGLEINDDKTTISKISNFYDDFDKYRSQSKYAVDQISKHFATSTDKQKDLAFNEFVALIQSDTCQDDLSFIFSHLEGVKEVEDLKMDLVGPALSKEKGRGSLFKNLFNFALELEDGRKEILKIQRYGILQSEVLTSCIINLLESSKGNRYALIELVNQIESKLTYSDIVSEHLAYLVVNYNCEITFENIRPAHFISAISSASNCSSVKVTKEILNYLNLTINEMKSLSDFIKVIFAFAFNENASEVELEELASLFYSKVSLEQSSQSFQLDKSLLDLTTTNKFYFLLCLFSVSKKNSSTELIESMWKFCAHNFNENLDCKIRVSAPNWLEKIKFLEINDEITNWIISSIVDGNIFRGVRDDKKVFEKFHNTLLVYLSLDDTSWKSQPISDLLKQLKGKSEFYEWLIDNKEVSIFPQNNKKWFERNIIENGVIALKRLDKILLRKPTGNFSVEEKELKSVNGYAELIVDHKSNEFISLKNKLYRLSLRDKIRYLSEFLESINGKTLPSIFCAENVIDKGSDSVFSPEFCYHSKIIIDDEASNVKSYESSTANFIRSFFEFVSEGDAYARMVYERYIAKLDPTFDLKKFITKLATHLDDFPEQSDNFHFDVAISSTLYVCLLDLEPIKRIDAFVLQYSKFYNNDNEKHIFAIEKGMNVSDNDLSCFLTTIRNSLEFIIEKSMKSLPFYLSNDIQEYESVIKEMLYNSSIRKELANLRSFSLTEAAVSLSSRTIKLNGQAYDFEAILLVNPVTREFSSFDIRHITLVNKSDHVFSLEEGGVVYVIAANSYISQMYFFIKNRFKTLIEDQSLEKSYQIVEYDEHQITSIKGFEQAITVIENHKAIDRELARGLFIKWLAHLPQKFHMPIVTLIQGHEYMGQSELDSFISKVKKLQLENENPFLIKRVEDYNGTHRILYRDDELGRMIAQLSPFSIVQKSEKVTLITDLILSGSQIKSAFKYYFQGGDYNSNINLFECNETQRKQLLDVFKGVREINICTILYNSSAISDIERALRDLLNNNVKLNIVHGRDIGGNAFFQSSEKISEKDKEVIRNVFKKPENLSSLYDNLHTLGSPLLTEKKNNIELINLVARYKSLPKKSFDFLRFGLKADAECKPLDRIRELNDK